MCECVPAGAERNSGERERENTCAQLGILGEKWCEITSVECRMTKGRENGILQFSLAKETGRLS